MSGPVTYRRDESIAVITMDDGKVNALGPTMLQALNEALDNADRDDVGAVVIAGNHRVFSGGFDLKILKAGEVNVPTLLSPRRVQTKRPRFVMRLAGRNIRKAFRSFARRRSYNYCSETSAGRAAAFWRSAVTHPFRARPTFRRSTIFYRVTYRCRAATAVRKRCPITLRIKPNRLGSGPVIRATSSA